ncbi:MAG TPA: RluA family pseudouridine synthase [Lactobacillaceae bacterium]|jgi:23S rRNA pseudouridine1911/1915/1917 synthase
MITLKMTIETGRLDAVLAQKELPYSRTTLATWIKDGRVAVNGKPEKRSYKVAAGDTITIEPVEEIIATELVAEDIPLDIVYEDDDILIVNKEQGMVVHPAAGHATGTLVNALLHHAPLSTINGEFRPGIVHRIDRDTSGLLMIAKNDAAHQSLSAQLKAHKNERVYYALVHGEFAENEGVIKAPIARHPNDRKKQAVVAGGRDAVTHFKVVQRFVGYTLLEVRLETGRTHQIRVHMAYIKHPVAGDTVYGRTNEPFASAGQILHAKTLSLTHPKTGEETRFESELPTYFTTILAEMTPLQGVES